MRNAANRCCVMFGLWVCASVLNQRVATAQELPAMEMRGRPAIASITSQKKDIPRFAQFELTVNLSASYDNPFDPEQINLHAEFISPSGKKVSVSGFFYQAYRNRNEADDTKRPLLDAVGEPCWKVRFAPTEVGTYTYAVTLRNRFGTTDEEVKSKGGSFRCVPSDNPGFIRVSPVNHRYFQFDDGTSFFAVGQNLQNDWPRYHHFRLLHGSGCNAVRVWMFCHWSWLEWTYKPDIPWAKEGDWMRSYAGTGKYNQRIAWIADHTLARCERAGLHLMFCLGTSGELSHPEEYGYWGGHPYSIANGGCLKNAKEFWTDERARKLYKQRLRYIIARYGYSTNVWAWEFWNELGDATPEIVAWHREMADYVRQIDPNRHLTTTSTWRSAPGKFSAVWDLPQMDFTQSHIYPVTTIRRRVAWALRDHPRKPHIIGEGGGPSSGEDGSVDPDGIDFHDSLWAGAMSGAAGTTLPWWWRERIEPHNLFFHYAAIAKFVKDIPWATTELKPAPPPSVSLTVKPKGRQLSPVMIVPPIVSGWGGKPERNRFRVGPDGAISHQDDFCASLYGHSPGRVIWRNPPTIEVNYPVPGRFIIHVVETSHAVLEVLPDGEVVLTDKSLNVRRERVRKDFSIDVPAGEHEIKLQNTGSDWVRIGYILLTNYRDSAQYPDIDIYALQSDKEAILWIHHRLNQWAFRALGVEPQPIAGGRTTISGLNDGTYRVEWWNTYKGEITRTEEGTCRRGSLDLDLPVMRADAACKIRRVR